MTKQELIQRLDSVPNNYSVQMTINEESALVGDVMVDNDFAVVDLFPPEDTDDEVKETDWTDIKSYKLHRGDHVLYIMNDSANSPRYHYGIVSDVQDNTLAVTLYDIHTQKEGARIVVGRIFGTYGNRKIERVLKYNW